MAQGIVLVVEDQAPFREFLQITLSRLGLDVVTALTGKIALRIDGQTLTALLLPVAENRAPEMPAFGVEAGEKDVS